MVVLKILFVLTTIAITLATPVNTTDFWKSEVKSDIEFQSFAGYQPVDWYRGSNESGIYYQIIGAANTDLPTNEKAPLFVWLQGGPGESSLIGSFTQIGPVRIVNQTPYVTRNSWNLRGHLLFIDQPLNVGFSYDSKRSQQKQVGTVEEATNHLINFFFNFYKEWPNLKKVPTYIVGQSYGAMFAPSLAKKLLTNQTFRAQINLNIKGVIINSGWIDPMNQINYYDSLLYSIGIVSNRFRDAFSSIQSKSLVNIFKKSYKNASQNYWLLSKNSSLFEEYLGGLSPINFRSYDESDHTMNEYLQTNKGRLGVQSNITYIPFNINVFNSFRQDLMKSYTSDLVDVLTRTKVMIVSGQQDYIVNSAGVQNYLNILNWPRVNSWKSVKKVNWQQKVDIQGKEGFIDAKGWTKIYGNLWFIMINGAGHKICTDQPDRCLNLLGHFIYDDKDWTN